jgi:hypothetical protein
MIVFDMLYMYIIMKIKSMALNVYADKNQLMFYYEKLYAITYE